MVQSNSAWRLSTSNGRYVNFFLQSEMQKNIAAFDRLLHKSETFKEVHRFLYNHGGWNVLSLG